MMVSIPRVGLLLLLWLCWAVAEESSGSGEAHEENECEKEEYVSSSVRVASLNLEEVKTPLLLSCFIIAVILAKMGWHHPYMHLVSSNFPESCMLIFVGVHVGGLVVSAFKLDPCNSDEVFPIRFTPELFFSFLLPPIVFASGYFMNNRAFFENFVTIIVYALLGTLWNAFALGFTLYGLSKADLMLSNLDIPSALLFGTICAAVDPVAVLAVFDEIHVNKLLHILVFGESLLNDAVTIVLFLVLSAFANVPFDMSRTEQNIGVDVTVAIVQFIVVVGASILIGTFMGCFTVILSKYTAHVHVLEPILLYALGYLAYLLADLFAFSGIVSLITFTIILRHYVPSNIAWKSNTSFKYILKMLSIVSEMIIFLFLGVALFDEVVHSWDTGLVLWTLLFASLYRPIGVVVLTLIVNLFRIQKISMRQIFILSYSGLRGAVAFSLAFTRIFEEGADNLPPEEKILRRRMLTSITFLLLFTVFIQGTTIKPLVRLLRVKTVKEHTTTMNESLHGTAIDHINSGMEDIAGHFGFNRLRDMLHHLDVKYFRKIFERHPDSHDISLLHTFKKLQYKESRAAVDKICLIEPSNDKQGGAVSTPSNIVQDSTAPTDSVPEHCIPTLNEVLRSSYYHPHDNHNMHQLPIEDLDLHEHHIRKFRISKKIKYKARKTHRRRAFTISGSSGTNDDFEVRVERQSEEPKEGAEESMQSVGEQLLSEDTSEVKVEDTQL